MIISAMGHLVEQENSPIRKHGKKIKFKIQGVDSLKTY